MIPVTGRNNAPTLEPNHFMIHVDDWMTHIHEKDSSTLTLRWPPNFLPAPS